MAHILTISGSPTSPSRTGAVLGYCAEMIHRQWHAASVAQITVRDLDAVELMQGRYDGGSVMAAAALVGEAEGIILGTPVYRASFSGVLKAFLDVLPQGAFGGKVVLPVAVGGSPAHTLMIDYALRPVCAALSAYHVLPGVYLIENQFEHADGRLINFAAPEAENRMNGAIEIFIHAVRRLSI